MEDSVIVVGGGTMGAGIAYVAAQAGHAVELVEPDVEARERALERIRRDAVRAAADESVVARVRILSAVPTRSEATIAIEAVPERFELKRAVFAELAQAIAPDALLATNTSALSVAEIADAVERPERVVGLHFFNPPLAMKLVEVVRAPDTAEASIQRAFAFVEGIGKTPVLAADSPGFIVNRVARPYYLQAIRALERGVASIDELDALARAAGFRMGPFELMDFIGLDVNLATSESIYARTEARRLEPLELQRRMVGQGLLGRKSGTGFYDYRDGKPQRLDVSISPPGGERDEQEFVAIVGFGGLADELAELLEQRYARVERIENDDLLDELSLDATIVIDVGDGIGDRGDTIVALDGLLAPEVAFFADAYATDLAACAGRMKHPQRLAGYGILGSFAAQSAVEVVDSENVSDDTLALAQELFAALGKGAVLVEDVPGLFLGRTIGSIVNEAVTLVHDGVATPDDVDAAMRLGTNYPIGPVEWGREIGGRRIARILQRLSDAEGSEFAPHRALWVLDLEDEAAEPIETPASLPAAGLPGL